MAKKFVKGQNFNIPKKDIVNVREYTKGRTQVTNAIIKNNNLSNYKKQTAEKYYDPKDDTFKSYQKNTIKSNSSLNRTIKNTLRPLLENNFSGGNNEVFVTLTYAEAMSNVSTLTTDFNRFWRRLCNHYKTLNLGCIYVKELQEERQSWHIHALIKEKNNKNLNILYEHLKKFWGLGNVWINRVSPVWDYSGFQISVEKEM